MTKDTICCWVIADHSKKRKFPVLACTLTDCGPGSCFMSKYWHFWFSSGSTAITPSVFYLTQLYLRSRMRLKNEERSQIYPCFKLTPDIALWGRAYRVAVAFGQQKGLNVTMLFPVHFKITFEVRVVTNSVKNSQAFMLSCELETSSAAHLLLPFSLLCKHRFIAMNRSKN